MRSSAPRAVLDEVLAGLLRRYAERVPDVGAIGAALVRAGLVPATGAIENDHIAFRTIGVPQLGLRSLERIFLHLGYAPRERYAFAAKKLDARWYSPPADDLPRIFISELRVSDLSAAAAEVVRSYTDEVRGDPVDALDLDDATAIDRFLHTPLWRLPRWTDYERLLAESEYAAWAIYNRYYLNHYTISVHALREGHDTLAQLDAFLEAHGFRLNDAGGKIKVSADGLLLQSSTVAEVVMARFADGEQRPIAGSYVEFAERRPLPGFAHLPRSALRRAHRREGFEVASADRIFESTYTEQTARR